MTRQDETIGDEPKWAAFEPHEENCECGGCFWHRAIRQAQDELSKSMGIPELAAAIEDGDK